MIKVFLRRRRSAHSRLITLQTLTRLFVLNDLITETLVPTSKFPYKILILYRKKKISIYLSFRAVWGTNPLVVGGTDCENTFYFAYDGAGLSVNAGQTAKITLPVGFLQPTSALVSAELAMSYKINSTEYFTVFK